MIALDATSLARLQRECGICALIELDFTQGTLRYTTWPVSLTVTVAGTERTYLGLGNALALGAVRESEDVKPDQLTVSLAVTPTVLGAALGSTGTYRRRPMRVYHQLLDEAGVPLNNTAVLRFAGRMDKVQVRIDEDREGGTVTGRVELLCSRAGIDRARHSDGLRLSHAQQQRTYPTDRGLEMLTSLIETPRTWLTKKFQEQ